MEQQRMTVALFLCFLVWFGWMFFLAPKSRFPANNAVAANGVAPGNQPVVGGPKPAGVEGDFKHPQVAEESWTAKNSRYEITFTNRGGAIQSLVLVGILERRAGDPLRLLQPFDPDRLSLTAGIGLPDDPAATANWEKLAPVGGEIARFRFTYANGLELTKTFAFDGEKYGLQVHLSAKNLAKTTLPCALQIAGAGGVFHDSQDLQSHHGGHALLNDKERWDYVETDVLLEKLKKGEIVLAGKTADWAAVNDKYFATVLIPKDRTKIAEFVFSPLIEKAKLEELLAEAKKTADPPGVELAPEQIIDARTKATVNLTVAARMAPTVLGPDQTLEHEFTFYAGPKRIEDLEAYKDLGVNQIFDLGWFTAISNLMLWILGIFHDLFGNYGVSIICLTIAVKCCLFPLTKKGQISAFRMQKVAPEMNRLKEKYEDDKQRLNTEMLKLYREHGVNPITGCLPMFFQLPVFIGLYRGLGASFDLRQQPFFGWISDLSRPDQLATLPFHIPFTGTNELHLLPILMTITWLIQSMMQPKSPDPQMAMQQKMFTFMPLIFGFMLYSMPSGLILYWFTSTLLAIGEQQYIKKKYLKA